MPPVAGAELNQKFGTGRRQLPPSSLPTVRIRSGSQLHLGPSGSPCSSISAWPSTVLAGLFLHLVSLPVLILCQHLHCTPGGHVQLQQAPSDFFNRGSCCWCKRCIYDVGLTSEFPLLFLHFQFCQSDSVSGDLPSLGHWNRCMSRAFLVEPIHSRFGHTSREAHRLPQSPPQTKTRRPRSFVVRWLLPPRPAPLAIQSPGLGTSTGIVPYLCDLDHVFRKKRYLSLGWSLNRRQLV
jgi:hypothetical protein